MGEHETAIILVRLLIGGERSFIWHIHLNHSIICKRAIIIWTNNIPHFLFKLLPSGRHGRDK